MCFGCRPWCGTSFVRHWLQLICALQIIPLQWKRLAPHGSTSEHLCGWGCLFCSRPGLTFWNDEYWHQQVPLPKIVFWLLVCFTHRTVKWHNMHSLLLQHFAFQALNIAKIWNVILFCNSMFPSLDNDCIIQDLAFQVLNSFGVINFSIRPKKKILCFSWLGFPRHEHKKMIVKTWQTNFRNLSFFCSRLGMPSFEMLHCFAIPCSQVLTMIAFFQVLNPFGVINFKIRPLPNVCLSWLGFPRHEHKWKLLSRLGRPISEI